MTRASVDLPQPDSPITPTVWPRCTDTLISRSTLRTGGAAPALSNIPR